jgi:5-methylcytosine-specific restriction endonuclease McrA
MTSQNGTRTCTKCGKTKSLDEFRLQKRSGGVYPTSSCRDCLNEYARQYMRVVTQDPVRILARRARDAERYEKIKSDPALLEAERQRKREYAQRPESKLAAKERAKNWAAANPERRNEIGRRWRERNPGAQSEASRASHEQRKKDPEYRMKAALNQGKRRWREFNQGNGVFTAMEARIIAAFWDSRCAYCGDAVQTFASSRPSGFDHVIPLAQGGGHGPDNMVVCCKSCNDRKNSRPPPDPVLELLRPQMKACLEAMPEEAYWSARSAVPRVVTEKVFLAAQAVRGQGIVVGTWFGEPGERQQKWRDM